MGVPLSLVEHLQTAWELSGCIFGSEGIFALAVQAVLDGAPPVSDGCFSI